MATQLFLLNDSADTHRGTNTAKRNGSATPWRTMALSTARGSLSTAYSAATVAGATNGVEPVVGLLAVEWLSPPVAADVTISGTITANIWASESNMSANVAINVIVDIVRAATSGADASNTIQNIVQSTNVAELAVTTNAVNNFTSGMTSGGYTDQTLNRGDRLRIRVVGDDAGTMASGYTFQASAGGSSAAADGDSYVRFTENITFETPTSEYAVLDGGLSFNYSAVGYDSTTIRQGLGFTASGTLNSVGLYLAKTGSPTDNLVVEVQSDSAGSPSGAVVATLATIAGSALTTTRTLTTWSSLGIALTRGTPYWIVLRRSGAPDATNYFVQGMAGSNVSPLIWKEYGPASWGAASTTNDVACSISMDVSPLGGSTLYLTDTASAVSTASVDREVWTSRGAGVQTDVRNTAAGWTAPLQLTDTAGGTVVDWFTRPLTAFTLGGMAVANLRALESAGTAAATLRCEIARVEGDGTSPTVWASWCIAPTSVTNGGNLSTSEVARTCNVSGDDLAISDGQRLRIRIYVDDSAIAAMTASQTVTLYYAGTSGGASGDSYITFPQTLTEYGGGGPFTYEKAGFGKESG